MSDQREKELKLRLLSRQDHLKLIEAMDPSAAVRPTLQLNHYFDTRDLFLARRGGMLRLRLAEKLILTFKLGGETRDGSGYFDSLEIEAEVPRELLEKAMERPALLLEHPSPPIVEVRQRFGSLVLVHHGSLRNERLRCRGLPHSLEVDRMTFPDGSEAYELEIETEDPEGARRWIEAELTARGIAFEPQHRTKFQLLLGKISASRPGGTDFPH